MRAPLKLTSFLLALGLLSFAPAYAETVTVKDPKRDAVSANEEDGVVRAPRERRGDLTNLVIAHSRSTATFTVHTRQRSTSSDFTFLVIVLKTDKGDYSTGVVKGVRTPVQPFIEDSRQADFDCDGLKATFKPRIRAIQVTVPRDCLGDPRWIRAGGWLQRQDGGKGDLVYVDVLGTRHANSDKAPYSRKVHVGR